MKCLRRSASWLGFLVVSKLAERSECRQIQGLRLRLVDATTVSAPGSQGTDWRVHLGFDLGSLSIDAVELTGAEGGESLSRFQVGPREVLIGDRGYAHRRGLWSVRQSKGDFLVRLNWQNLPLQTPEKERFDLLQAARSLSDTEVAEFAVQTVATRKEPAMAARVVMLRKSEEAAEQARQKIRQAARKKGRQVDPRTLEAAGYIFLLTSLPADQLKAAEVMELYRFRWQVELAFKRLKSLWGFGSVPVKDPDLARTYIYAKLLIAVLPSPTALPPTGRGGRLRPIEPAGSAFPSELLLQRPLQARSFPSSSPLPVGGSAVGEGPGGEDSGRGPFPLQYHPLVMRETRTLSSANPSASLLRSSSCSPCLLGGRAPRDLGPVDLARRRQGAGLDGFRRRSQCLGPAGGRRPAGPAHPIAERSRPGGRLLPEGRAVRLPQRPGRATRTTSSCGSWTARPSSSPPARTHRFLGWTADGGSMLVEIENRVSQSSDLYRIAADGYAQTLVNRNSSPISRLAAASPDGRYLAYRGELRRPDPQRPGPRPADRQGPDPAGGRRVHRPPPAELQPGQRGPAGPQRHRPGVPERASSAAWRAGTWRPARAATCSCKSWDVLDARLLARRQAAGGRRRRRHPLGPRALRRRDPAADRAAGPTRRSATSRRSPSPATAGSSPSSPAAAPRRPGSGSTTSPGRGRRGG